MVRLMCAPPEENLRPNVSRAGDAAGKPMEEELRAGTVLCIESRYQLIVSFSPINLDIGTSPDEPPGGVAT
jgi:hypothetical protein